MSVTPRTSRSRPSQPRIQFSLAGAVALVLLLAACTQAGSPSSSATSGGEGEADHVIAISGTSFEPSSLTIAAGESVVFENGASSHRIVEGEEGAEASDPAFEALSLGPDDVSDPITFDEPGSYPITCTIHPSMQMTIIVE